MQSVAWIQFAPVKGLALVSQNEIALEHFGVRENRRFYLVDDEGRMTNGKFAGKLVQVVPEYDERRDRLALRRDGETIADGTIELGEALTTDFFGRPVDGRLVVGPWSAALSDVAGRTLRLARVDRPGSGVDRGTQGGVSLVGTASLAALADAAGIDHVDGRRFRMLFGVDGVPPHAEDRWLDRHVRIGNAVVELRGNVGRCAVTTQNPDTGEPDLDTLCVLGEYRGNIETTERLPFGVWGKVVAPGRVRMGDIVEPA
jgi:uncharacterized protein YcbX